MSICSQCSAIPVIPSSGLLVLYSHVPQMRQAIMEVLITEKIDYQSTSSIIQVPYVSEDQLIEMVEKIDSLFIKEARNMVYACCIDHIKDISFLEGYITIHELFVRLMNKDMLQIIQNNLFTHHLQAIVDLNSNEVYGYEFLLRPITDSFISPGYLFATARESGLQALLDSKSRISSIEISSKLLSEGIKRFINFLPSSIYDPAHCLNSTFAAVEKYKLKADDLVFEVVETEKIEDIAHLKSIFHAYKQQGMQVALDDVGSGYSTIDVIEELHPNFVKIDRQLIRNCDQDKEKQKRLELIIKVSKHHGITVLAEGMERREEWEYCKSIGIDLGQGYFISKPKEKPVENLFIPF